MLRRGTGRLTRIGIYSGAFDPIHAGNLAFVEMAIKQFKLNKVFLLIEPTPRHKQGVKALKHRQRMAELAIAGHERLGLIILEKSHNSIEDSLPELAARFAGAELYLLVHGDVFRHVQAWPKIHNPIQQAHLAIGLPAARHTALKDKLATLQAIKTITINYDLFDAPDIPAVSKRVRAALRAGRVPVDISETVKRYIESERLYASELTS